MNAIEIVKRANTAYNAHDADALAALYADDASYSNPHAGQGVTGKASVNFPKAVWAAYPDAFVELISVGDTGEGLVALSGYCVAPTLASYQTAPQLPVAPLHFLELPSFGLRVIKFVGNKSITTGRICQNSWGSKRSKHQTKTNPVPLPGSQVCCTTCAVRA